MTKHLVRLTFFSAILVLASSNVLAQSDAGHIRFVSHEDHYVVNLDGSFSRRVADTKRALTTTSVDSLGRQAFSYSSDLQSFRLISAETIKADGKHIAVDPAGVQTQDGMLSSGMSASMADYKLVVVTFPQLAPGDSIRYEVEYVQLKPELPGRFDVVQYFHQDIISDDTNITVDAPKEMVLHASSQGMDGGIPAVTGGRRVWQWHYSRSALTEYEPYGVDSGLGGAYLAISNYDSYEQIGAAYYNGELDKVTVTPAIQALADSLAAGASDQHQEAVRIYDWVRFHIRYVATYIGSGGWVPHEAGWILEHRYGDCKDHVALLRALLAARGIQSTAVLIAADYHTYALPPVPVRVFNHAITYLPKWNQFVDATDSQAPFDVLPRADAGKNVVMATAGGLVGQTPLSGPDTMNIRRNVAVDVASDGSAKVKITFDADSGAALSMRSNWLGVAQGSEARWLKDHLRSIGYNGAGTVHFTDTGGHTTLSAEFEISDYLKNTEAGAVRPAVFLDAPVNFDDVFPLFSTDTREYPYLCLPAAIHDSYDYTFPANLKILAAPRSQHVAGAGFEYSSHTELTSHRVTMHRDFVESRAKARCEATEYADQRAIARRIEKNVEAQILFEEQ